MAKFLFIIAQEGFRDEELKIPRRILDKAGFICEVASESTDLAFGKLGMQITPDLAIKDVQVENYEGVCLVGGPGAPILAEKPEVISLVKKFYEHKKVVTAICIAPIILAKAGILKGKKATIFRTEESVDILTRVGVEILDQAVVEDGLIITANGPAAASAFAQAIKAKLLG